MPEETTAAVVERVVDGDTVNLTDGTRVRMVGIDAPELGRRGNPDDPYARDAHQHLSTLLELGGHEIGLMVGEPERDRYGRLLAVAYTGRHGDLAAHLVRNGLALVTAIPPLTDAWSCQREAERHARNARLGLWSENSGPVVDASELHRTGFAIVRGKAGAWSERKRDRFLSLDDALVLRFRDADIERWFDGVDLGGYAGHTLEVRGWVHPWGRDGRAITVQHPAAVEILAD